MYLSKSIFMLLGFCFFFFFKQKTAYEMRISDWSSDVCSSDLQPAAMSAAAVARRCRGIALALCVAIVSCLLCVQAAEPAHLAVEQVAGLVDAGRFEAAETGIDAALAQAGLSPAPQRASAWPRERLRRTLLAFSQDQRRAGR